MAILWPEEGRHINRWDLDSMAYDNPVVVRSVGGHTGSIYNSYALRLARISKETPDPEPPAIIARDPDTREPTGLVSEAAETPLRKLIPRVTKKDTKEFLRLVCKQLLEWGITTAHDASVGSESLGTYQEPLSEGQLLLRFGLMLRIYDSRKGEDCS